jgi:hypothetical protein
LPRPASACCARPPGAGNRKEPSALGSAGTTNCVDRFRRAPGAATVHHVAGSCTFTGSSPRSGLDLSAAMFAPSLLGCTGRQHPVLTSLRLARCPPGPWSGLVRAGDHRRLPGIGRRGFPRRSCPLCRALGKRHPNQDTTLQLGRRNCSPSLATLITSGPSACRYGYRPSHPASPYRAIVRRSRSRQGQSYDLSRALGTRTAWPAGEVRAVVVVRLSRRASCPVGAENLCHQAVFMNHASSAVAPEDAEVV